MVKVADMVGQVVTRAQKESCSPVAPVTKNPVSEQAVNIQVKVFTRLLGQYGRLFSKRFEGPDGEAIMKMSEHEWAVQLTPYSEGQVMAALTKWIGGNKYPPKVSELIEIIKADKPVEYFARLPRPKPDGTAREAWRKRHGFDKT